jgi:hypothetical protein
LPIKRGKILANLSQIEGVKMACEELETMRKGLFLDNDYWRGIRRDLLLGVLGAKLKGGLRTRLGNKRFNRSCDAESWWFYRSLHGFRFLLRKCDLHYRSEDFFDGLLGLFFSLWASFCIVVLDADRQVDFPLRRVLPSFRSLCDFSFFPSGREYDHRVIVVRLLNLVCGREVNELLVVLRILLDFLAKLIESEPSVLESVHVQIKNCKH